MAFLETELLQMKKSADTDQMYRVDLVWILFEETSYKDILVTVEEIWSF